MVEFGFFALVLGFCLATYGLIMGVFSLFRPVWGVVLSARNALIGVSAMVGIGSVTLWYGLLTHDFSIRYAFRNSSVDMPPLYLFSAFWSALEGSHLVWTLILSTISAISLATVREKNRALLPGLCASFGIVLTFMLLLNVWASAPLTRLFPAGQFGAGMNALLQNPYMAAHPPSLFIGYSSLVVGFAYSLAALLNGNFTSEWLVSVRRWSLFAWTILGVGIFLGGKWAYVELGWAGYWAWDPVENSSFMPWLAITAALHTLLVLDKTQRLPRLALFLCMLAFSLTFLGTFITRSGIISSVHSFAESDIGPAYLMFILLLLTLNLGLLFTRGLQLNGAGKANVWTMSKESTLLFTNFFLLFLLALVCIGTLLPLIVEAVRGVKISIQQPFFNAFTPWIGVGLVSILGVGNLMRWRNGKIEDPLSSLAFPALWALIMTATLAVRKDLDIKNTIGFFLILWTAGSLVMDFVWKLKLIRWNGRAFWKFNKPYIGAWVVHMGFLISVAGFMGAYRGIEQQVTLNEGQTTEFYGYQLRNDGLNVSQAFNYTYVKAQIQAKDADGHSHLILPMRSKYTNKEEWLNEIGVHSTFWHDVYLVLASFDMKTKQVTLKMHINPTVKLVWTRLVVMVIGALIGLCHRIVRRSVDVSPNGLAMETMTGSLEDILSDHLTTTGGTPTSRGDRSLATATLVAIVALTIFGFSGIAFAQAPSDAGAASEPGAAAEVAAPKDASANANSAGADLMATPASSLAPLSQMNPKLREVGEELRCPTCQGISVLESETPQSQAMKAEIEKQLLEGKSKDQILKFFQERYGEWILRKPDAATGFGFWVWAVPIGGLLIGPFALILALKRTRRRTDQERAELMGELKSYIASQRAPSSQGNGNQSNNSQGGV